MVNIKIQGKEICKKCKKEFQWEYQVPQKLSSNLFDIESYSRDKASIYEVIKSIEKDGYKMPVEATIYCPHCGSLNTLEYKSS